VTDGASGTARGALVGLVSVGLERAVAFVVVLVLARTLAPATFGTYGFLLAGMAMVQVVADQGIEVAAVAAMAGSGGGSAVVTVVLGLRVLVWAFGALPVALVVLPRLAPAGGALVHDAAAASLAVLLGPSLTARGALRARGRMVAMATVALADAGLGGVALIAAARAGAGLATLFAVRAAASAAVSLVAFGWVRPRVDATALRRAPGLAAAAWPLAVNAVLLTVGTRAGHLVTMRVLGAETVAYLAAAARITEVVGLVPEGVMLAVFPRMAAAPARAETVAAETGRLLASAVLAVVCVVVSAAGLLATRLFGAAYAPAGDAIAILAWGALFTATGAVILYGLVATGRSATLVWANLGSAAGGLALQVLLVPRMGLRGAALATVATAALGQGLLAALPASRSIVLAVWRTAATPAALALAATLAARVGPTPAAAVALVLGAYAALVHALGVVRVDDWRALGAAARRRTG
jgi:O-antigen/teichoic acid export membrane protein